MQFIFFEQCAYFNALYFRNARAEQLWNKHISNNTSQITNISTLHFIHKLCNFMHVISMHNSEVSITLSRFQFRPGISTPLVPTGFQNFKSTTLLKADSQIHRCTIPYVTTRPKSQASWAKTLSNWTPCFVALEIGIIILILMLLLLYCYYYYLLLQCSQTF